MNASGDRSRGFPRLSGGSICLLLLVSLGACSLRRDEAFVLVQPGSFEVDLARLLRDGEDPVSVLEAVREERGLALSFWAEEVPEEVTPYVSPHPCGESLTALVKRVPEIRGESFLVPERVVELDEEGGEIGEWQMPIDSDVVGIRGDSILLRWSVNVGEDTIVAGLSISQDGAFRVVPKQESSAVAMRCPPLPSFGGSHYLRCWRFVDLATGRRRVLAYQRPCT